MRDIEGIEEVIEKLRPYLPKLEEHFNKENERFKILFSLEHDLIGRILKTHLVVENYLTYYIISKYDLHTIDEAKLSFFQKAQLIPSKGESATFIKPAIIALNKVRNKISHNLNATIDFIDIKPIMEVLSISRPGVDFIDPYSAIESFCAVACSFLIFDPPELQYAISNAFKSIHIVSP